MKVQLFATCLVDQLFPRVGRAVIQVLEELGHEVAFDRDQSCCSQPAFNSGYWEEARPVALRLLETYGAGPEPIVTPSGSCAAMIKVFIPQLLENESEKLREMARTVAERTWEFSDFLINFLEVESTGASFRQPVTYHDSCHLLRELGIREEPRTLIRSVQGVDFREMEASDRCCGFGGAFSVKFPEISAAMGREKLDSIRKTGARWVVANDMGCLMHLQGLIERGQEEIQVLHLAELLAKRA